MNKLFIKFSLVFTCFFMASTSVYAQEEVEFIEVLNGYMDVSEKFIGMASEQESAVFFAIEGIVEIYEEQGKPDKAAKHLQSILKKYPDNKTIRNIVRFKLRDVYKEKGETDLALQQLEAIIAEN